MPIRPRCLKCSSRNSAFVLWGRTMWRDDLREKLDRKELELAGCFVTKDSCTWHCNDCGHYYHTLGLREFSEATRKGKEAPDYIRALIYSYGNKPDIDKSKICGCYYCLELYPKQDIYEWITDIHDEPTALCPFCDQPTVLTDIFKPDLDIDFLKTVHDYWYEDRR